MKVKLLFIFIVVCVCTNAAHADCVATTRVYTACRPAGYLINGVCEVCPNAGTSTSADGNNTGITACYIPAETVMADSTGRFAFTENCHYSN